jgi:hypothetical protein
MTAEEKAKVKGEGERSKVKGRAKVKGRSLLPLTFNLTFDL